MEMMMMMKSKARRRRCGESRARNNTALSPRWLLLFGASFILVRHQAFIGSSGAFLFASAATVGAGDEHADEQENNNSGGLLGFLRKSARYHKSSSPPAPAAAKNVTFPTLNETVEMASLSLLVYKFLHVDDDSTVCGRINNRTTRSSSGGISGSSSGGRDSERDELYGLVAPDLSCEWYRHDRNAEGTQVLLVYSRMRNYVAVVFAGTDDWRTSLTDADLLMMPFGDAEKKKHALPDPRVKVHAGFNHAVFDNGLFDQIEAKVSNIVKREFSPGSGGGGGGSWWWPFGRHHPKKNSDKPRLLTTGHSLGAANGILTAVAFAPQRQSFESITSINFGCPRIGNTYWRDFIRYNPTVAAAGNNGIAIWRVVYGWDLVPRLPEFLEHVGHTIQIHVNSSASIATSRAYYEHYGDDKLGYAGVPFGWSTKPFVWLPIAVESHRMRKYWHVLRDMLAATASSAEDGERHGKSKVWANRFVPLPVPDSTPEDDDDYWNPDAVGEEQLLELDGDTDAKRQQLEQIALLINGEKEEEEEEGRLLVEETP